jgi:hypothetical protein
VTNGSGISLSGSGTAASPYVLSATGTAGGNVNLCSVVTLSSGATCSGGVISIVSGTASVTISGIPSGYVNLSLILNEYGTSGAANVTAKFNSDTTASNYSYQQLHSNGTTTPSSFTGSTSAAIAAIGDSAGGSSYVISIPFYSNTVNKVFTSYGGQRNSSQNNVDNFTAFWNSTAAITSITLTPTTGNFGTGFMAIYGTN